MDRLEQARQLFFDALQARESGERARAERLLMEALNLAPDRPSILVNLSELLIVDSRHDEAAAYCERALRVDPQDSLAWLNLGTCRKAQSNGTGALECFDKSIASDPGNAVAHYNRGCLLASMARKDGALLSFERAIALRPDYGDAHFNRGIVLRDVGRRSEALASFETAISLDPANADAHVNRALVLRDLDRLEEALAALDRTLAVNPASAEVLSNRGLVLHDLGRLEPALDNLDQALALAPDSISALSNRGLVLRRLRRFDEALANIDQALTLNPDHAAALSNRGIVLYDLRRYPEAIASFERAIAVEPTHADALVNAFTVLREVKRYDQAEKYIERILDARPDWPYAPGLRFEIRALCCTWGTRDADSEALVRGARSGAHACLPFIMVSTRDDPEAQLAAARTYVADKHPSANAGPEAPHDWHERLRVAYLSSDFKNHAVALLTAELFELHDRARLEVFGFSLSAGDGSPMRRRIERAFDHFHDVSGTSDREVAALCRRLGIDIVVDLNGHTLDARTDILAYRAAPLQVNYLGYPGTMGAGYVDYIIADPFLIPPASRHGYAEQVVYLPDSFQVNDRRRSVAEPVPSRAAVGLPAEGFVFCCFNGVHKLTPDVFASWMRLLKGVQGSVLWLVAANPWMVNNLRREARLHGVAEGRLVFAQALGYADHLSRYRLADLCLDTLPFNGGTTTSDALWAGVPVVTCAGKSFAARMAGSLLHAVGLPELITHSMEEYEALALRLASERATLAGFRTRLAANRDTRPLFDSARFCRHIESAYFSMWQRHVGGAAPCDIWVEPIAMRGAVGARGED